MYNIIVINVCTQLIKYKRAKGEEKTTNIINDVLWGNKSKGGVGKSLLTLEVMLYTYRENGLHAYLSFSLVFIIYGALKQLEFGEFSIDF